MRERLRELPSFGSAWFQVVGAEDELIKAGLADYPQGNPRLHANLSPTNGAFSVFVQPAHYPRHIVQPEHVANVLRHSPRFARSSLMVLL